MAISTYTELQSIVDAYLGHGLFSARVPDFITMAEASFNRKLRVRQMIEDETLVATGDLDGEYLIPDDYLQWISVRRSDGATVEVLEFQSLSWLNGMFPAYPTGVARYWTISEKDRILVYPAQDDDFLMVFYQKIPALSDSNTTNWLLTEHPDLYLFGALCEAELFGVNDTRAALWKTRRDEIMEEIMLLSNRSRGPGTVRVMQATP